MLHKHSNEPWAFIQMWSHPPLSVRHSLVSVECYQHITEEPEQVSLYVVYVIYVIIMVSTNIANYLQIHIRIQMILLPESISYTKVLPKHRVFTSINEMFLLYVKGALHGPFIITAKTVVPIESTN